MHTKIFSLWALLPKGFNCRPSHDTPLSILYCTSSSDSDDQDSAIHSPLHKTDKSLKSGKEAKITSTVLYPQSWPHCYLSITHGRRDVKYEELTLAEFVAGYSQILWSPDLSEVECSSRLKYLVSLMYFSQLYDWQAVSSFHGAVLLEIERGLLKWEDSFLHLESRTLYGHLKVKKPSTSASFFRYHSSSVLSRLSKKHVLFPTRSLRFAPRRTQMAPQHLYWLLGERTHTSLTPWGI